jgi:hypothetical protein
MCRNGLEFPKFLARYMEIKGWSYESNLEFDENFIVEVLAEIAQRVPVDFEAAIDKCARAEDEHRLFHGQVNKNRLDIRGGRGEATARKSGDSMASAGIKLEENFLQDLRERLLSRTRATERLLKERYQKTKENFLIPGGGISGSPNRRHGETRNQPTDVARINPFAEKENQLLRKIKSESARVFKIKTKKSDTNRDRATKKRIVIKEVQSRKTEIRRIQADHALQTYLWKEKRYEHSDVLTDEEILVRKNNWKKEWFKFLELAKTVKLLAILGTHAKDIKIYSLGAVQCVRRIQKCWIKYQLRIKLRGIGLQKIYLLQKLIKKCKTIYAEVIFKKKMNMVKNTFFINN